MATVIVDDNIARILTADALNSGLKVGDVLNIDPAVAGFMQGQFGTNQVQIQSVTFEELENLDIADGIIVRVSNVGMRGFGSYWSKLNNEWYPLNGRINFHVSERVYQEEPTTPIDINYINYKACGGTVLKSVIIPANLLRKFTALVTVEYEFLAVFTVTNPSETNSLKGIVRLIGQYFEDETVGVIDDHDLGDEVGSPVNQIRFAGSAQFYVHSVRNDDLGTEGRIFMRHPVGIGNGDAAKNYNLLYAENSSDIEIEVRVGAVSELITDTRVTLQAFNLYIDYY